MQRTLWSIQCKQEAQWQSWTTATFPEEAARLPGTESCSNEQVAAAGTLHRSSTFTLTIGSLVIILFSSCSHWLFVSQCLACVVFLTGVLEYMSAEILELAGNAARDNKSYSLARQQHIISPRHISLAILNDEELNSWAKPGRACALGGG